MTDRLDDRIHALMERVVDEAPVPPMLPAEPAATRRAPAPGWVIGLAVATVVLVVVGGISVLLGGRLESEPMPPTESPTPTTVAGLGLLRDIPVYEFGSYELTDWLTTADVSMAISDLASGTGLAAGLLPRDVAAWSNLGPAGEKAPHEEWEFTTHRGGGRGEAYEMGWYVIVSEYIGWWSESNGSWEKEGEEPAWNATGDARLPGVKISGPHTSFFGEGPWFLFQGPRSDQIVSVHVKPPDAHLEALLARDGASVVATRRNEWTLEFAATLLSEMRWTLPGGPRISLTLDQVEGLAGTTLDIWLQVPIVWGVVEGGGRFPDITEDRFTGSTEILPIEQGFDYGGPVVFDHPPLDPLSDEHRLVLMAHEPTGVLRAACQILLDQMLPFDRIDLAVSAVPTFDGIHHSSHWPDTRTYPECEFAARSP